MQSFLSADLGYFNRYTLAPNATDGVAGAPEDDGGGAEREVVEPDVIRQEGDLLFVLNQYRGLSIVDLESEELLSQTPTYGFPRDLYLVGDRAYVLVGYAGDVVAEGDAITFNVGSRLYVLDVSDVSAPSIVSTFDLAGDFVDSRLVGDVLYAVSAQYVWNFDGTVVNKQQNSSSWVSSINIADPNNISVVDTLDFGGYGSVIQTTNYAIFVAAQDWDNNDAPITYIDISDPNGAITVRGNIKVPGYVPDKFKMDAYQGVLRVVSIVGWPNPASYITTVDLADPDNLVILGQSLIEGTQNEQLFATRFDGDRAYVVTYFVVDPLFVLDLSDPAKPAVTGVLEVPGWSTHIEPRGDRLIALGVDDTDGGRKVSVSIFNVTDPAAPALLDRKSFGENWSWSNAYSDVKAFTVLEDTIIVPFSGWNENGGYERLQFVSYTADTLTLADHVDLEGQILRSFRLDSRFYGVTTEEVAVIGGGTLDDLSVENRITLAENASDVAELPNGTVVTIISKYNTNKSVLRAADQAGNPLSSVEMDNAWFDAVHTWGDHLVLLRQNWEEGGKSEVTLVDYSNPALPVVGDSVILDISPAYWWGPWYDRGGPMPLEGVGEGDTAVPPGVSDAGSPGVTGPPAAPEKTALDMWFPWFPTESSFVVGDKFVIHGWSDKATVNLGTEEPQTAIAVLDLNTGEVDSILGLGLPNVQKMDAVDGQLYISYKITASPDIWGRGFSAYQVTSFNPETLALGASANVPGAYLQYDPATDVLTLEDFEYTPDFNVRRMVRTVSWDGGDSAETIETLPLDDKVGQLYPHGARLYFDYYPGEGYELGSINVDENGALAFGPSQKISGQWAWFLDADGDTVCLIVANRAIARYDFSGPEATLRDITEVMQSPSRLRIGESMVYFPSGYSGVLALPR